MCESHRMPENTAEPIYETLPESHRNSQKVNRTFAISEMSSTILPWYTN